METIKQIWEAIVAHPCMVISFMLFGALGAVAEYFYLQNNVAALEAVTTKELAAGMLIPAILAAAVTRLLEPKLHCPRANRVES